MAWCDRHFSKRRRLAHNAVDGKGEMQPPLWVDDVVPSSLPSGPCSNNGAGTEALAARPWKLVSAQLALGQSIGQIQTNGDGRWLQTFVHANNALHLVMNLAGVRRHR